MNEQPQAPTCQSHGHMWGRDGKCLFCPAYNSETYKPPDSKQTGEYLGKDREELRELLYERDADIGQHLLYRADLEDTLNRCAEALGIGSNARNTQTLLTCIGNARRRAECLSVIENAFFTRTLKDDEGEDLEECSLNWGAEPTTYRDQFRAALLAKQACICGMREPLAPGAAHFSGCPRSPLYDAEDEAARRTEPADIQALLARQARDAERYRWLKQFLDIRDVGDEEFIPALSIDYESLEDRGTVQGIGIKFQTPVDVAIDLIMRAENGAAIQSEPHVLQQIEHALDDCADKIDKGVSDYIRGCISDYRQAEHSRVTP